jgi:hypothetical protein
MEGQAYPLQQTRSLEEAEGLLREACRDMLVVGRGQEAVVCGLRVMASDEDIAALRLEQALEALHLGGAGAGEAPRGVMRFKVPVLAVYGIVTE